VTFGQACLDTRLALDVNRQELARRVGITPRYLAMIEAGRANPSLRLVEDIADAIGLELDLSIRSPIFPGGQQLRDPVHAWCSAYVDRRLRGLSWSTAREVEVVHGRSHGWIDVLAFDHRSRTLLIIEIKTRLDDLGALERQIGWYERMAWQPARALGWRLSRVISCVLALASDEVESVIRRHKNLVSIAFPTRAAELIADPAAASTGARGLALIDPPSRRQDWLIRTSVDGRRSRLPYRNYADAATRLAV
jgi:transcriptional regulator with XRE-family HTH domain